MRDGKLIASCRLIVFGVIAVLALLLTTVVLRACAALGASAPIILTFGTLPRLVMALCCGSALGLSGLLMQQVLRNPMASPNTLGVANGAQLALSCATLFAPGWLVAREWVAMAGGCLAAGAVFLLSSRRGFSAASLLICGLIVSLYLGALNTVLMLLQPQGLSVLFIWGAGSLTQNGWDGVASLLPRVIASVVAALLLMRPLQMLSIGDDSANSLGIRVAWLRTLAVGVSIFVAASTVASVGLIGFVGLGAPALARLMGARTLGQRTAWSVGVGAVLLATTDLVLQLWSGPRAETVPTGAAIALFGAPLLLMLLPRAVRGGSTPSISTPGVRGRRRAGLPLLISFCVLLLVFVFVALGIGRGPQGWAWNFEPSLLNLRLPRVAAAGACGLMLAVAGTLLQRMTGNDMASPEVLGLSAGAALGILFAIFCVSSQNYFWRFGVGALGGVLVLGILGWTTRALPGAIDRLLLTGVALASLFEAVQVLLLSRMDPRGPSVLGWLSGSTYFVEPSLAASACALAIIGFLLVLPLARWLEMAPLGNSMLTALGVSLRDSRLAILGSAALLTTGATLVVGPLSFVGLFAAHAARLLGFQRATPALLAAGILGCLLMVAADWMGRMFLFPQQLPAGLAAALLGGGYLLWGITRR